ncbi:MAG: YdiU family protein [Burkholderiales bacterium]|nr:YdiU family protein [Burkholderiales bacterium]
MTAATSSDTLAHAPWQSRFAHELPSMAEAWTPAAVPAPQALALNGALAQALGLDPDSMATPESLAVLAGNAVPAAARPVAQAYAGHQFGNFVPRLGDGRALLIGELPDRQGRLRDVALKGSGHTPFSRGGDGKAAQGPVLREFLISEAMHALGIPTTRSLAAVATGESVWRDRPLPGAVLARVAASHLRVGSFQYAAAWDAGGSLRALAEHAIERHQPEDADRPDRFLALLQGVARRQAALVARWMGVGFIHGVMNTDNMTISGETIDYGPCAFMEAYGPRTVFSSIDTAGRYAYANQPLIARWNLARLAECLLPLLSGDETQALHLATGVVDAFPALYRAEWLAVMRAKLGLPAADDEVDEALAQAFLALLQPRQIDFTRAFRALNSAAEGDESALRGLFAPEAQEALTAWLERWQARRAGAGAAERAAMRLANPVYIARNHQVEAALEAAQERADLAPFERLLAVVRAPFDERVEDAAFAEPAPPSVTAGYQTFCGT